MESLVWVQNNKKISTFFSDTPLVYSYCDTFFYIYHLIYLFFHIYRGVNPQSNMISPMNPSFDTLWNMYQKIYYDFNVITMRFRMTNLTKWKFYPYKTNDFRIHCLLSPQKKISWLISILSYRVSYHIVVLNSTNERSELLMPTPN